VRPRGARKLPRSTPLLATFIERSSPKRLAFAARCWSEVAKLSSPEFRCASLDGIYPASCDVPIRFTAGSPSRDRKFLATSPDPRTDKLRHPDTPLTYLSSFSAVLTVAVQSFLIDTNPMHKVAVGSKIESQRQPYSVEQVTLILNRAQAETDDIFLPLLAQAYSGCRVSEIADCSTRDFNFVKNGDLE
jgi:integrase